MHGTGARVAGLSGMDGGSQLGRRRWVLAGLYAALLLVQLALRAPELPWTVDNGIKWLASAHGEDGLRAALPYRGRELDPQLRFFPIGEPFARVLDGRATSQYPPAFSLVSRPFLKLLGPFGGYVLPLIGALLAAWGAARLAERWDKSAAMWAFLFAGPLGPLAWYGAQFWEHTLVASCVVWAAVCWLGARKAPVCAALLLALGTWMREETVLFVPGFLVGALTARWSSSDPARGTLPSALRACALLLAVYAVALVPFLAWQRWITDSVLGFHFSGNLAGSLGEALLAGRAQVVRGLLWSGPKGATGTAVIVLTVAAAACVLAVRHANARWRSLGALVACALLGAVAVECVFSLAADRNLPMTLIHTSGLLLFAPWVLASLAGTRVRATGLTCTAAVALASFLLVTPSITAFALHWGPRVLLSALPLLAALAALGMARLLSGTSGLLPKLGQTSLVLGCLALQAYGGWIQARVTRGAAQQLEHTRALLAGESAPLVTSEWWYAATYAPLLAERAVFRAGDRAELAIWIELHRRAGGRHFWWATAAPHDGLLQGLGVRILRSETIGGFPAAYRHRLLELALD
jgi:hypothetical protein